MKVTKLGYPQPIITSGIGANAGGRVPSGGNDLQVLTSNGSNGRYWGENVRRITSNGSNTLLSPDVNFANGDNIIFAISSNTLTISSTGGGGGGGGAPTSAKYVTTAGDGTLSAEVIIPGLAGSPDITAGGANDDEFDTTDTTDPMTGWTTLGTPTTHNMNSTVKSHYYAKLAATSSVAFTGIYKAAPSLPFTVTVKVTAARWGRVNFMRAAFLAIAEATPGKLAAIHWLHNTGFKLRVDNYTNRTTFGSNAVEETEAYNFVPLPHYLRIVATSSTNVAYAYSEDGIFFRTILSGHNPGFTVGAISIGVDPEQTTHDGEAAFDWIRFT